MLGGMRELDEEDKPIHTNVTLTRTQPGMVLPPASFPSAALRHCTRCRIQRSERHTTFLRPLHPQWAEERCMAFHAPPCMEQFHTRPPTHPPTHLTTSSIHLPARPPTHPQHTSPYPPIPYTYPPTYPPPTYFTVPTSSIHLPAHLPTPNILHRTHPPFDETDMSVKYLDSCLLPPSFPSASQRSAIAPPYTARP